MSAGRGVSRRRAFQSDAASSSPEHPEPTPTERISGAQQPELPFGRGFARVSSRSVPHRDTVAPYNPRPFPAPPFPEVGSSIYGCVSFIDENGFFHLRQDSLNEKFLEWTAKWQAGFAACPSIAFASLRSGNPCLVRWIDRRWYRATYLGLCGDKRLCFFEDFGTTESVVESDLKAVDPSFIVGYEIPTTVYSCKLGQPSHKNTAEEYVVLTEEHRAAVREIIAKDDLDVDVLGYQAMEVGSKQRVVLAVDLFTAKGSGSMLDSLRDHIAKSSLDSLELRPYLTVPITFETEPFQRGCSPLQFPAASAPPQNERFAITVGKLGTGDSFTAAFCAVEDVRINRCKRNSALRTIYCDAGILSSMEENWTNNMANLKKPPVFLVNNSYLLAHKGQCMRVELKRVLRRDECESPLEVEVFLIDRGYSVDVGVQELYALSDVISVVVPKQAFEAVHDLTVPPAIITAASTASRHDLLPQSLLTSRRLDPKRVSFTKTPFFEDDSDYEKVISKQRLQSLVGKTLWATCSGLENGTPVLCLSVSKVE